MRKLRVMEYISLDGVIQAPGGPGEDRDGDFRSGGWVAPYADPAARQAIVEAHGDRFDLLLGRRTYDIWSGHWPKFSGNPIADGINGATKYVATHRPESLAWGPAQGLGANIVEGIRDVKGGKGPDLILWGSSTLTPVLLEHGLVDEIFLLICPVLLGTGKRFFAPGTPARRLSLLNTRALASGMLLNTYRYVGALDAGPIPAPTTRSDAPTNARTR